MLLKATALAEAKNSSGANINATIPINPSVSGITSESAAEDLGEEASPSVLDPQLSASAASGASASLPTDSKGKKAKPSPIGKIKRAFAAIVSPPSDKKKGQGAEGPQFKRRTNSESSHNQ